MVSEGYRVRLHGNELKAGPYKQLKAHILQSKREEGMEEGGKDRVGEGGRERKRD